jgi:hypothetical protein
MSDAYVAACTRRRGLLDDPAFDRVDAVRPAGRCAALGPVVADGDVDAGVVDGTELRVRPRIEEGAADRVLAVVRPDRPAAKRVVVALL